MTWVKMACPPIQPRDPICLLFSFVSANRGETLVHFCIVKLESSAKMRDSCVIDYEFTSLFDPPVFFNLFSGKLCHWTGCRHQWPAGFGPAWGPGYGHAQADEQRRHFSDG